MRIGLLITSIGNFGQAGFYNAQEMGLAKALDKFFEEVKIYKLISKEQEMKTTVLTDCQHVSLQMIPARSVGNNGIMDTDILDPTLDILVYFSDTQIAVPVIYRWTKKNHVAFYPYIGVIESHSTNRIKKIFVDLMFKRNLAVYRKNHCFVKTPTLEKKLRKLGVNDITVAPVGLDITLLKADFEAYASTELKKKYGYQSTDKVLLFIGRLINEKQPLRMVEIFADLADKDDSYKLLMVGMGELKTAVELKIDELRLADRVQMIERIPNRDIWELYRIAEVFVNLNQQEIFGMAILEAMFYGCKVVAWHAPGPDFIIENGTSGWLVNSNESTLEKILDNKDFSRDAHERIMNCFTWRNTAKIIADLAKEQE